MSRNVPNGNHDNVYHLDDYRPDPSEADLARRHRLNRRRAVLGAVGAVLFSGAGIAVANAHPAPLPVYCGYAVVGAHQGGDAVADQAAHSQHLPLPNNEAAAGSIINAHDPQPNQRWTMWIYSDGQHTAHIDTATVQEWTGLSNPCPEGPLPNPIPLTTPQS